MDEHKKLSPEQLAKRNAFRLLVKRLNEVSSRNLGRTIVAFFFMIICEVFLGTFFMTPMYMRIARGDVSDSSVMLATALMFAGLVVWALFQYGFFALLLRMVRGEYVTIGFVLLGFKKLRSSLPAAAFVSALLLLLSVCFCIGLLMFTDIPAMLVTAMTAKSDEAALSAFYFDGKVIVVALAFFALLVILVLLFAFLFPASYDEPNSFFAAVKDNMHLLRKRRLLLFRLLIAAGGRFLLIAFVAFGLSTLLAFTTDEKTLSLGKLALNFIYLVNFYTAVLRMYFAVPVLYEDARTPKIDVLIDDQSDSAVINETIALLEHGTAPIDESENESWDESK